MTEKAGRGSDAIQIPHITFAAQHAHFMNVPKLHQSVNRTPVFRAINISNKKMRNSMLLEEEGAIA